MTRLEVIVASTRPGRVGLPVGRWVESAAREHGGFDEVGLADLAEVDLPMMNEAKHPRFGDYAHEHTRAWSARIAAADAFAIVMPEYNHGFTAPLKNALDYLNAEWRHKPVGLVSYGGVSAGARAATMLEPVLVALRMSPVTAVPIPLVTQFLGDDGRIEPNDMMAQGVTAMLDDLVRTEAALRSLRAG